MEQRTPRSPAPHSLQAQPPFVEGHPHEVWRPAAGQHGRSRGASAGPRWGGTGRSRTDMFGIGWVGLRLGWDRLRAIELG